MSPRRMPKFCSRKYSSASNRREAVLKRIALKLSGDNSASALLTIGKFMPQTRLIAMSIR